MIPDLQIKPSSVLNESIWGNPDSESTPLELPYLFSHLFRGFFNLNSFLHRELRLGTLSTHMVSIGESAGKEVSTLRSIDILAEQMFLNGIGIPYKISIGVLPPTSLICQTGYDPGSVIRVRMYSEDLGWYGCGTVEGNPSVSVRGRPDIEIYLDAFDGTSLLPRSLHGTSSFFTVTKPNPTLINRDAICAGIIDHEKRDYYLFCSQGVLKIENVCHDFCNVVPNRWIDIQKLKETAPRDIQHACISGFGRKKGYFAEHSSIVLSCHPIRANDTGGGMNLVDMLISQSPYDPNIIIGTEPTPETFFLLTAAYFAGIYAYDFSGIPYTHYPRAGRTERSQLIISPTIELASSAVKMLNFSESVRRTQEMFPDALIVKSIGTENYAT